MPARAWLALACAAWLVALEAAPAQPAAESLARRLGVTKGLVALVGDDDGAAALKLAAETECLIYVQVASPQALARARGAADQAGLYGVRIYVDQGSPDRLKLADNLADGLVALGGARGMPQAEALRVIHPEARALVGGATLLKPFPDGVDDWSHPYHAADNNPLSRDAVARGPYLTQFLADPRYAPLPQVAVAAAGRIFKAFGHIAFKAREEPWLNTLAAFNGYNGTLLWRREIAPALMVHRSTLIATPSRVYFGDDKSCKVLDAATGALLDEIAPPEAEAGGTFWKWMALDGGVLYALMGDQEERDPVIKAKMQGHGWPWDPLSPGYNKAEHTWGFGRTLLAIDPGSKRILWKHREGQPVDSRALCLKNNRLYAFRFGAYLTCLDASTGNELWRKTPENDSQLFRRIGDYSKRQDWRTNWRTTAYLRCSDKALYFAGPAVNKLLAVSAADGRFMWEHPYDNYQVIIRDDGLFGLPGQIDKEPARQLDPLTGAVLKEIPLGRRACTRVTSSLDALFCRANGGSTRLDLSSGDIQLVSPMRPNCHDGVTIASGLLYWWPSVCDCNLTLYGITCLGPAGGFQFGREAAEAERLETPAPAQPVAAMPITAADWPCFRANDDCSVTTAAEVPSSSARAWDSPPAAGRTPTAPVAADNLVLLAGSDGVVRALDAATGKPVWKAYTAGPVRYPPALWNGRAYVGSGDGWAYCFEARTGRLLWRFRAAPIERRLPVYGELQSTWPVAGGVVVRDGLACLAAGIVNYDGTHLYGLDALTGRLRWQNNDSGHLDPEMRSGVSVQGQLLRLQDRLYLAGGNVVSPAVYDLNDGRCLNDSKKLRQTVNNKLPGSFSPRGNELYRVGSSVMVSGKPHYAHPKYPVHDEQVFNKALLARSGSRALVWQNNQRLLALPADAPDLEKKILSAWNRPRTLEVKPLWEVQCPDSLALAVGRNAAVVAGPSSVSAYKLDDGALLWTHPLPAPPVGWGLCLDRQGRAVLPLEDGRVVCFAAAP